VQSFQFRHLYIQILCLKLFHFFLIVSCLTFKREIWRTFLDGKQSDELFNVGNNKMKYRMPKHTQMIAPRVSKVGDTPNVPGSPPPGNRRLPTTPVSLPR